MDVEFQAKMRQFAVPVCVAYSRVDITKILRDGDEELM